MARPTVRPVVHPLLASVLERISPGIVLLDAGRRVLFANASLPSTLGRSVNELLGRSADELMDWIVALVPDPPRVVRDRMLFPEDGLTVYEEFELAGPGRAVVRWLARPIDDPIVRQMVVLDDITAEVDLARAQERLAMTDLLTQLVNRRGAEEALQRELRRARRIGSPVGVALIDVDRFKHLNDTHGHATGDEALRLVGACIAANARSSDLVARWGGEEFLVALPDTLLEGAGACAERIRVAVANIRAPFGRLTVSTGVVQVAPDESLPAAMARADAHLYAAKAAGRNCVRG